MTYAVLSRVESYEVQPARCRSHESPLQFREIEVPNCGIITVCKICGARLSWVDQKAAEPVKEVA